MYTVCIKGFDEKEYAMAAFPENPVFLRDVLRTGKASIAEHGLRAVHRASGLGCAGFARESDRVSTDHFLSEPDKACRRKRQVNEGGNT